MCSQAGNKEPHCCTFPGGGWRAVRRAFPGATQRCKPEQPTGATGALNCFARVNLVLTLGAGGRGKFAASDKGERSSACLRWVVLGACAVVRGMIPK